MLGEGCSEWEEGTGFPSPCTPHSPFPLGFTLTRGRGGSTYSPSIPVVHLKTIRYEQPFPSSYHVSFEPSGSPSTPHDSARTPCHSGRSLAELGGNPGSTTFCNQS